MLKEFAISVVLILAFCGADVHRAVGAQTSGERSSVALVPPELRVLAERAATQAGWAPLASYAEAAHDHEVKGLAYLALGYREYQAQAYPAASEHLTRASATGFLLA